MTENFVEINKKKIPLMYCDALVVGSGCAGLNAADWLFDLGVKEVVLATEGMNMGTSRNTGSDKQTYYKLSLSSSETDSVAQMCQSLFEGRGVNGDIALTEAACSARSFIKLVNLGVPFPTNAYGEYVGYMTDHDTHKRATSVGPLTSKYMTEALEKSVKSKNIKIADTTVIIKILVKEGKVIGALGIDKKTLYSENNGLRIFLSPNVILATGGPAGIYQNSVYPVCHRGMSGLAIEAGAEFSNLQEWQYGLASVDFRWNVSGTYQQVIPRYISVDENGVEREFLNEYFDDPKEAVNLVFKKGYQWPFDTAKVEGSSMIDLVIYNESINKNRKVYMDFRREPSVLENGFSCLSEEAYGYLENSDALIPLPIKRLEKMNQKAIALYKSKGIDLYSEPLRVEVCAQHNNGGVSVDSNWRTNIEGFYAAGEVAGTFGVYRPGGSALNSTQVGSLRAAEDIALSIRNGKKNQATMQDALDAGKDIILFILSCSGGTNYCKEIEKKQQKYRKIMSSVAAHIRIPEEMKNLRDEVFENYKSILSEYKGTDVCNIVQLFRIRDMFLTQSAVLSSMLEAAEKIGTRGGALVRPKGLTAEDISTIKTEKNDSFDNKIITSRLSSNKIETSVKDVRPIPKPDMWFENVWNEYNQKWNIL